MMNIEESTTQDGRPGCAHSRDDKSASASERWLIARAKSGSSSAFGELYELHRLRIYHTALRILRNRQDAEDALQRSFQRVFTNLCRFREDSAFSTWVTRIAINEALMMLRQRRATTPISETGNDHEQSAPVFDPADKRPTPEQAVVESERRTAVIQAVSCLKKSLRSVVLLREFQGLTSAEIARRLGLSVSAVKGRTFHARRHLRKYLQHKFKAADRGFTNTLVQ